MVQVDVFWSYGFGAGFAAAAARQIKTKVDSGEFKFSESKYFTGTVIYLACLFAPSGIYLLWQFTGWETMYAFRSQEDLPAWLVVLFAITNVTQGMLGFWVVTKLIERERYYSAHLQWLLGYFLMFFILVHGWDGTGYRRFFSATPEQWEAFYLYGQSELGIWMAIKWATTSAVAWTLYAMGVFLLPPLFWMLSSWFREGFCGDPRTANEALPPTSRLIKDVLQLVFFHTLGAAILASVLIRAFGWGWGWLAWAVVVYAALLRPGGLTYNKLSRLTRLFGECKV